MQLQWRQRRSFGAPGREATGSLWLEGGFCLVMGAVLARQILMPPVVGLANNGDFGRILRPFGLVELPHEVELFTVTQYAVGAPWGMRDGFWSSHYLLVEAALALHRLPFFGPSFDIRIHGVLAAALLGFGCWLVLRASRGLAPAVRVLLAAGLVGIAGDVAYVAYLNSLYNEVATIVFAVWTAGFAAYLLRRRSVVARAARSRAGAASRLWLAVGYFASSALLVTAKPQNAVLAPLLALLGIGLWLRAGRGRGALLGVACLAVALVAVAAGVFAQRPQLMREQNLHSAVFTGVLATSDDPRADLGELGLAPELARFQGVTPHGGARSPLNDPGYRTSFVERASYGQVGRFYARHPDRLAQLLWRGLQRSADLRPRYLGNFERSSGLPPRTQSGRSDLYSNLRLAAAPWWGALVLALLTASLALALAVVIRRRSLLALASPQGAAGCLALLAITQLVAVVAGGGELELTKHLLLFDLLVDCCGVALAMHLAARLARRLSPPPRPATAHLELAPALERAR